jgi:mannose-6-phosphate isomerase-like protein (cupin superfamily)/ketosteroid isomerase-like protein
MQAHKFLTVLLILFGDCANLFSQSIPVAKHSFDSLLRNIPGKDGERFTKVIANKDVTLFLFAPRIKDLQTPHDRDEFYIVAKGSGKFWCNNTTTSFKEGDLLFAPAGKEHRFENFSNDLVVWVIFYGEKLSGSRKSIIKNYLEAINLHDTEKLLSLQASDHVLIDALGNEIKGRDQLKKAWIGYFKLFPDYQIQQESITESTDSVIIFGYASGSLYGDSTKQWRLPISIRVTMKDDKISRWQVYADTKVPFDLINKP